jgi:hypothetical protein
MISWYERVFEAKVQYKNPALAFLTYDDEHHRFAFGNLDVLDPAGKGSGGKSDAGVDQRGLYATVQRCRSTTRIPMETESSFRSIALRRRRRPMHTCEVRPFPPILSA